MNANSSVNDLHLERFSRDNADLVLSWRNAAHVRVNFLNDSEIAREDHLAFVDGLADRPDQNYFILYLGGRPEAVLNVNLNGTSGQWGCYIGAQSTPRPGLFPTLIAVSGVFAFGPLGCSALESEVIAGNEAPQKLNAFLGVHRNGSRVQERPSGQEVDVLRYQVTRSEWLSVRAQINKLLTRGMYDALVRFDSDPEACITKA